MDLTISLEHSVKQCLFIIFLLKVNQTDVDERTALHWASYQVSMYQAHVSFWFSYDCQTCICLLCLLIIDRKKMRILNNFILYK